MKNRYFEIAQLLVKHLRGKRSQMQLSVRLGYKSNQVYRWESDDGQISWSQFVELCQALRLPLRKTLQSLFLYFGEVGDIGPLAAKILGHWPKPQVAEGIHVSVHSLARWLRGQTDPPLAKVLELIQFCTLCLVPFLDLLTDEKFTELAPERELLRLQQDAFYKTPWALAVLSALDTKAYRSLPSHELGWICKRLGLTQKQEDQAIQDFLDARVLVFQGDKLALLHPKTHTNFILNFPTLKQQLTYWTKRCTRYLEQAQDRQPQTVTWGYKIFNCSEQDLDRIRECYAKFYHEVTAIVAKSACDPDRTIYLSSQIIDVAVLPQDSK